MRGSIHLDSGGQHALEKMPGKHTDVWVVTNTILTPRSHRSLLRRKCSLWLGWSSIPKIWNRTWLPTSNSVLFNREFGSQGQLSTSCPQKVKTCLLTSPEDMLKIFSQKRWMTDRISILFCGLYKGLYYKWVRAATAHLWCVHTLAWVEKGGVQGGFPPLYTFLDCLLFLIMHRECFSLSRQNLKLFSPWKKPGKEN